MHDAGALAPMIWGAANAYGFAAFASLQDLNVSYRGHWRRLVGLLQPTLVDSAFRGGSEERIDAAAPVLGAYKLFFLGPMLLVANQRPHRQIQAEFPSADNVKQGKRTYRCHVLNLKIVLALGILSKINWLCMALSGPQLFANGYCAPLRWT